MEPTMIGLTIDDQAVEVPEDSTVLQAAERLGIAIPTLCHHEGLAPYGACRLCVVEVEQRGRVRTESSCTRPVEDGMVVRTDTEDLREIRRMTAELLLAQCPGAPRIIELARSLGVEETRFPSRDLDCVLCGLCTRACRDEIGTAAIGFAHRGRDREVTTPFSIQAETCIGCGACAAVCPTGRITIEDRDGKRIIRAFNTELELAACADCGSYFAPGKMLEHLEAKTDLPPEMLTRCPACRRRRIGTVLREAMR